MKTKFDKNLAYLLLQAVLLASNSLDETYEDLNYRYKISISYIYSILAVIYSEKSGLLPDTKLLRQINYIRATNEDYLFQNALNSQCNNLYIKNLFFKNYFYNIKI
ncbi:MAG: hypothetical protein V2B14_06985, partial [bacterium]